MSTSKMDLLPIASSPPSTSTDPSRSPEEGFFAFAATDAAGPAQEECRAIALRLHEWSALAKGAYAANTLRAWKNDWSAFSAFTHRTGHHLLPSTSQAVRAFLLERAQADQTVATLRRMASTITRVHEAAGLDSPVRSEVVRLTLRECARRLGTRQAQSRGLVWQEIETYLRRPALTVRDHRDRALVCVAYDGSLRSEELVDIDLEHLTFAEAGPATLLIPASKTDPEGEGALVALAPSTVRLLQRWLNAVGIEQGAAFRRVVGRSALGERLTTQSVTDVFQRVGKQIGLEEAEWQGLSGHSARVGSTQDLFASVEEKSAHSGKKNWPTFGGAAF